MAGQQILNNPKVLIEPNLQQLNEELQSLHLQKIYIEMIQMKIEEDALERRQSNAKPHLIKLTSEVLKKTNSITSNNKVYSNQESKGCLLSFLCCTRLRQPPP